jgi:rhodanese-related sulfurtransferase
MLGQPMKKILLPLLLSLSLQAEVKQAYANQLNLNSTKTKIIDIRTETEWKETGIVKGSILLTFFDDKGGYDVRGFIEQLNSHVKPNEKFALICRTGSRTRLVSQFLDQNGYQDRITNIVGGVMMGKINGVTLVPYK